LPPSVEDTKDQHAAVGDAIEQDVRMHHELPDLETVRRLGRSGRRKMSRQIDLIREALRISQGHRSSRPMEKQI
jgi:hypothetical protein